MLSWRSFSGRGFGGLLRSILGSKRHCLLEMRFEPLDFFELLGFGQPWREKQSPAGISETLKAVSYDARRRDRPGAFKEVYVKRDNRLPDVDKWAGRVIVLHKVTGDDGESRLRRNNGPGDVPKRFIHLAMDGGRFIAVSLPPDDARHFTVCCRVAIRFDPSNVVRVDEFVA
jgi:hypothetical protein